MSITYNTNWAFGSYKADLIEFMIKVEALKTDVYFDGTSIAIGIGYDLIQHTNAQIQTDLSLTLELKGSASHYFWINHATSPTH